MVNASFYVGRNVPDSVRDEEISEERNHRVVCPVCGEEDPEDFYLYPSGEILGCSECIRCVDAYDYYFN